MMKKLYFIAMLLPVDLDRRISALKKEMQWRYHASNALKLPAHITLIPPFRLEEEKEAALTVRLESFAKQQVPFGVRLSGFGSFPPRVIFVKIKDPTSLAKLQQEMKSSTRPFLEPQKGKALQSFHPHISIASKDLERKYFRKAWGDFRDRPFEAFYEASSFYLLKHNGKHWENLRRLGFDTDLSKPLE